MKVNAIDRLTNSKVVRTLFAVVLAIGLALPTAALSYPSQAEAAGGTVHLYDAYNYGASNNGGRGQLPYGNWGTHYNWSDRAWGSAYVYCMEPAKSHPAESDYGKLDIDKNEQLVVAALYYGYGGPGFDSSVWPSSTGIDGTITGDGLYFVLTHIVLAEFYSGSTDVALAKSGSAFSSWYNSNMGSVKQWIRDRVNSVPAGYAENCFMVDDGKGSQRMVGANPVGRATISKTSANPSITAGNSCYSLEGAVYGVYSDRACTNKVTEVTTDANGKATTKLLATGTYWVKEITPSNGYELDTQAYPVTVTANGNVQVNVTEVPANDPAGILLSKLDTETGKASPLGAGTLGGAQFNVRYYDGSYATAEEAEASGDATRTWVFETDTDGFINLNESYLVSGELYLDGGHSTYPLGTYLIQETKAPVGYNLDDAVFVRTVTQNGDFTALNTFNSPVVKEQVKRGDIEFTKKSDNSAKALANVAFLITSNTTGESHVVVTDENGKFDSSSKYNRHTADTNGNDAAVTKEADGTYTVDDSLLSSEYGVWFGTDAEGTTADADDDLCALPYDTYTLTELPCAANEGMQMIAEQTFKVTREGYPIDLGTFDDTQAYLSTTASDKVDGDSVVVADSASAAVDKVEYYGAVEGRAYKLVTTICDLTDDGKELKEVTTDFTAAKANGKVNVELAVDTSKLDGHTLSIKNELYSGGKLVADHNQDLSDTDEQVTVVPTTIGTTAVDGTSGTKETVRDSEAVIVDTVAYKNAIPGQEYTVTGKLMVKGDDGATAYKDADGNEVTAKATFTPEEADGTVDVTFRFDASNIDTETELVVYESMAKADGTEVAKHEDADDEGQTVTVTVPEIGTTATDAEDGDHTFATDETTVITDTIAYRNLVPGKEYKVTGTLHVQEVDGEGNVTDGGELKDADGNPVTAETTFTPDDHYGTVEVTFTFDSYKMDAGTTVVAFEDLTRNGKTVAVHADIDDEGQSTTAANPGIQTQIADDLDGDQTVAAGHSTKLNDAVDYHGLALDGGEYTVYGMLFDQASGLPILAGEGASDVSEDDLTAFTEALMGALGLPKDITTAQATHATSDEGTQEAIDELAQSATDAGLGELVDALADAASEPAAGDDSAVDPSKRIVTDKVDWKAVSSVLDEYSSIYSLCVTAQSKVVPEKANGTLNLEYAFDSDELGGKTAVAMTVAYKADLLAAQGIDLSDSAESVTIKSPRIGTTATDKTDGDHYLLPSKESTIVDTVAYENLIPGKEYTLTFEPQVVTTNPDGSKKASNLVVDDEQVKQQIRFTPNESSGTVDIEVTFDSTKLDDPSTIVAYETLELDGEVEAEHKDADDEGQTVTIATNPDTYDKTGVDMMWLYALIAALAAAGTGTGVYAYRKHRRAKAEAIETEAA